MWGADTFHWVDGRKWGGEGRKKNRVTILRKVQIGKKTLKIEL